jgi:hypothetical protein
LTDPDGLLEGTDFKKVRYHVLRPGQPARRAELQRLLLAALHDSSLHQRLPRRRKK